jgi:hypothetical protein
VKFLEAEQPDKVSIADLLHEALTEVEPARPVDRLHASSLTNPKGFCPREVALCMRLNRKPYPSKYDAPMLITFHEGRDKQARLNNHWLRHRMVGDWYCLNCHKYFDFCKVPGKCCSHPQVEYREVVFWHAATTARGSLDAILDVGKSLLRLVEFKIMAQDEWLELKAPLAEHRVRSELYLEIIKGSTHPKKHLIDTSRIHVVYCLRGYGKLDKVKNRFSPFKEYIVPANPQSANEYLTMAEAVVKSKATNWNLIPEGICETMFVKRASSCSVCKECFSGKFSTFKWKSAGMSGGV